MRTQLRILAAAVLVAFAPLASAQITGATTPEQNKGQALVASKIAANFDNLAGGEENSLALVNALRTGGEVTLVTTVPPPEGSPPGTLPTTTETTFAVPTKPMGWGNVKHALALAQDQLARAGIADPTAEQLQTALMGGDLVVVNADGTTTTTSVNGILTMRADGMGWGNIAKAGGTRLGPVASKVDMSNKSPKASTTTTSTGVTTAAGASTATTKASKGITTAAGVSANASMGKGPSKGITTAGGASATHGSRGLVTAGGASAGANPSGHAYGRGIVTGAGGGGANVAAMSHGKPAHAGGAGLVTGGGNSAAASGITNARGGGGNAGGHGKGQGNGKGKGG
jgi:hypothetical protein